MLECLAFILGLIIDFIKMLFTIDVGFTSLGTVMCVTFIFLPMVLTVVNFIKVTLVEEIDDRVDYEGFSLLKNPKKLSKKTKNKKNNK